MSSPPTRRVVDVVELLSARTAPVSVTSIASSLTIARTTALAVLTELTDAGWVEKVTGGYVLGGNFPTAPPVGESSSVSAEIERLASITGCGVTMSRIESDSMTVVVKHHGGERVIAGFAVGRRVPLRYPAGASVMLGRDDDERRTWVEGATGDTRALLESIRRHGVAVFRPRDNDSGLVDVLADVLSFAGAKPIDENLRRRVDRQLIALTSRPYSDADMQSPHALPVSYLTAAVPGTRYEIQLAPLRSEVGPDERARMIDAVRGCSERVSVMVER
ncbi:MAG: helix-turn-helix domain-containing protein [Rhodococcus sp. (in: high G+C Gram-positive bacteria)]